MPSNFEIEWLKFKGSGVNSNGDFEFSTPDIFHPTSCTLAFNI